MHSYLWQTNSTSSKGKPSTLLSQILPLLFLSLSILFVYCPPSSSVIAHFQESWVCTHQPLTRHSRQQFPWAHPLPQPSRGTVQPHSNLSGQTGRTACWGNPAGSRWMWTDRGLRGVERVRANQTQRSEQGYEGLEDSKHPSPASHVLVQLSRHPQWNSPSQHKWAKSWAHFNGFCPKPESLGIPRTSKRALHAFPETNCMMPSWKTWILAFYGFTMDYIQVTT